MNTSLKKSAFAFFQIFRLLQLTLSNANELLDIVPSFSPLGTCLVACTQTLFYFSFRSFGKHRQARERGEHSINPLRFIFYHACSTVFQENRGSVNRLLT